MAKILILEDDTTFAQLLEGFLTKNGHEVTLVTHIKQSLNKLMENEFDLFLIDYRLPDGIGLMCLLISRDLGLSTPIIIMTSFNDVRTAVKSMQMGAFDYITKPVNPDEFLMVIKNSLAKKDSKDNKIETNMRFYQRQKRDRR